MTRNCFACDVCNLHSNMFLLILDFTTLKSHIILVFTFQYVSINTLTHRSLLLMISYLHSNMFLLIQIVSKISKVLSKHLHSNMFLLIPKRLNFHTKITSKFTFQYVSINTDGSSKIFCINIPIYIPICFY